MKFGGPKISAAKIRVTPAEIKKARASLTPEIKRSLAASIANVTAFAKKSLRKNWSMKNAQGAVVGERFDPLPRVGLYIPGGTAPLVSSAIMTCGFAKAAGVPEIVAVTPAGADGTVAPALLAALPAHLLRRPVRLVLDRDEDMAMTGQRHPFMARYKVGGWGHA